MHVFTKLTAGIPLNCRETFEHVVGHSPGTCVFLVYSQRIKQMWSTQVTCSNFDSGTQP